MVHPKSKLPDYVGELFLFLCGCMIFKKCTGWMFHPNITIITIIEDPYFFE
jgi:hypothetical protein